MEKVLPKRQPKKPIFKQPVEPEFLELQQEVDLLVKRLAPARKKMIWFKILLFPTLYLATYALLLLKGENTIVFFIAYSLMGFFLLLNFLNLVHDAVHGVTFRKNRKFNKILLYFFDVLGANSFIWKVRHLRLHHAFPNIMGWDSDLEQSPLVRIFPQSSLKKIQQYQHLYLPFLYPLYLFNWLLVRDFRDFFDRGRTVHSVVKIPNREYFKLFIFKFLFMGYILLIPKMILEVSWGMVLVGFTLFMLTASIISLLVLLSPHASVESTFPQLDENYRLPHTWFKHQLVCTNDVSNDNFFIRFFMASFNYHIAHHLFPHVHHVFYPEVSAVIQRFSREHQLPYRKHSLGTSLFNHYLLLKKNSRREDIFEETM